MAYREQPTSVPGVTFWRDTTGGVGRPRRIMPDGCLDLIFDGERLFVAGPDTTARRVDAAPETNYVALRMARGVGPAVLGVPAHELTDRSPALDELWAAGPARRLSEQVASSPADLLVWVGRRRSQVEPDPLGARMWALAWEGVPVAEMAHDLGCGERALHRRSLASFGYGPRRLGRVLRLGRALDLAAGGIPLADAAARCGYADQPHLARDAKALGGASPTVLVAERSA